MNPIFPIKDTSCLYTILNKNQDTLDLVRMRAVCRKWREVVDYISRNLLLSLGARVNYLEEATVRIFQITVCFNKIIHPDSKVYQANKIREVIPKLERITQLKLIEEVFTSTKFDIDSYTLFLKTSSFQISENLGKTTFMTILVNFSKNIIVAAKSNSHEGFLYILNHYPPSKEEIQKALLPACKVGNFTMIHTLIDIGADPTQKGIFTESENETYLTAACKSYCFRGVELLIKKGANIEEPNILHEKPIGIAARASDKIFNLFVEKVKNLGEKQGSANDKTLAHFAAEGNKPNVIYWLVCKKIGIDDQNIRGLTPLMIAIREKSTETFYVLLECGASLEKTCNQGYSPLDYAVMTGNEVFIDILIERNNKTGILYQALKTAVSHKKTNAINKVSKALGVSTPVKYGMAIIGGALLGGFLVKKYFDNGE